MSEHEPHFSERTGGIGWEDRVLWAMGARRHRGSGGHEGGGAPFGFGRGGHPFRRFPWDMFAAGARARRGDIRAAILALLSEKALNGYQIMQELEQRSRGMWRPSSGSVYPTLQQLEDEGLISAESSGAGRSFQLSEKGRAYVKEHSDEVSAPWESIGGDAREQTLELMKLLGEVASAARQVIGSGNAAQVADAKKILKDARKSLYRLLSEDDANE